MIAARLPARRGRRRRRAGRRRLRRRAAERAQAGGAAGREAEDRRRPADVQLDRVHEPGGDQALREALRRQGHRLELRLDAGDDGQAAVGQPVRPDLPDGRLRRPARTGRRCCGRSTAPRSATATASTRSSTIPGTTRTPATPCPYGMYTTGIAWREDKVGELTGSWNDLAQRARPRATSSCSTTTRRRSGRPTCSTASSSTRPIPAELEQDQGDARAPEGRSCAATRPTPAPNLVSGAAWIHHAWNGDVINARNQSKQPENRALPDLRGGDPGRLGLHGDPGQRAPPGHGDAVHRLDARSRDRVREHLLVRLSDADQGHRGRVRRAGGGRPGDPDHDRGPRQRRSSSASCRPRARRPGTACGRRSRRDRRASGAASCSRARCGCCCSSSSRSASRC